MATIQIRDVPPEAYETIRRRAKQAGQSIQSYMRDQVIGLASRRTKEEAWAAVESTSAQRGGATLEQILADLDEVRR